MLWTGKLKNNRSAIRFSYSVGKDKTWLKAWIINACHREVSLTTKDEIPSGSDVEIELIQPDRHGSVILSGKVAQTSHIKKHNCFFNHISLTNISEQAAKILKQINGTDKRITRIR